MLYQTSNIESRSEITSRFVSLDWAQLVMLWEMLGPSVMCDVGQEESGYKSEESPGVLSVKHINNRWRTPCPHVNYHIYTKHMTHNTLHQHHVCTGHHPHTLHYWPDLAWQRIQLQYGGWWEILDVITEKLLVVSSNWFTPQLLNLSSKRQLWWFDSLSVCYYPDICLENKTTPYWDSIMTFLWSQEQS